MPRVVLSPTKGGLAHRPGGGCVGRLCSNLSSPTLAFARYWTASFYVASINCAQQSPSRRPNIIVAIDPATCARLPSAVPSVVPLRLPVCETRPNVRSRAPGEAGNSVDSLSSAPQPKSDGIKGASAPKGLSMGMGSLTGSWYSFCENTSWSWSGEAAWANPA